VDFDTPFRDLGFPGAPFRSTVLLQPTSGCLVNLTEWPPFVISLEEVELVHFERVQFHLKNFDMVFVFKNYNKKVSMINAIPMNMLDHVKNWLNSCQIHFTEGIQSLNWAKIMKTIVDDPESFFDTGGWTFLEPESDSGGEDDDEEEDEDETFKVSEEEVTEEDSEDSEELSEVDEDESDDEDYSEEGASSEESGKDWSDLEAEAAEADKNQHFFEDEYTKSKGKRPGQSSAYRDRDRHSGGGHSSKKHKGSPSKSSRDHHRSSSSKKRPHDRDSPKSSKRPKK